MLQTWSDVLANSAALMNDQERATYTDAVLLPYLNMALMELEELFELNNIPVTNRTSATITIPTGTDRVGFNTNPQLPLDLLEIQEAYESYVGQNNWIPIVRKEFLTPSLLVNTAPISQFGVWAWIDQEFRVIAANQNNDVKFDYICTLFPGVTLSGLGERIKILKVDTFLQYRVAGLVSSFIEENLVRSQELNSAGAGALDRSLGISVKSMQAITVRRKPFRAAWKGRRTMLG